MGISIEGLRKQRSKANCLAGVAFGSQIAEQRRRDSEAFYRLIREKMAEARRSVPSKVEGGTADTPVTSAPDSPQ